MILDEDAIHKHLELPRGFIPDLAPLGCHAPLARRTSWTPVGWRVARFRSRSIRFVEEEAAQFRREAMRLKFVAGASTCQIL